MSALAPVGRAVVAVVGQKVVIELPENVQRDATVRGRHVVVGLPEHGVEAVQGQELAEELVGEAVDVQKTFQFLRPKAGTRLENDMRWKTKWTNPRRLWCPFLKQIIPWLRWGLRSRICWWPVPETCRGRLKPSEWWGGSDQWSGLEAGGSHAVSEANADAVLLERSCQYKGRLPGGLHLNVALLQKRLVTVGGRPGNVGPLVLALGS